MTDAFNNQEDDSQTTQENASVERTNHDSDNPMNLPEPPTRWRPDMPNAADPAPDDSSSAGSRDDGSPFGVVGIGTTRFELDRSDLPDFLSARRFITAAQVTAIVSLFFGGVFLSLIAIACALIARNKLGKIAAGQPGHPDLQQALRRSGNMILIVAGIALALNIAAVIFLYPILMDMLQTGDFGSFMGSSGSSGTSTGNTTWG